MVGRFREKISYKTYYKLIKISLFNHCFIVYNILMCIIRLNVNGVRSSMIGAIFLATVTCLSVARAQLSDRLVTKDERTATQIYTSLKGAFVRANVKLDPTILTRGDNPIKFASGFFISSDLILTTYDAFKDAEHIDFENLNGEVFKVKSYIYDQRKNIAIFKVNKPSKNFAKLYEGKNNYLGQNIYALGNSGSMVGFFAKSTLSTNFLKKSQVADNGTIGSAITNYYMSNLPFDESGDGSLILDSKGIVIGIISFYSLENKSYIAVYNNIIPISEINESIKYLVKQIK